MTEVKKQDKSIWKGVVSLVTGAMSIPMTILPMFGLPLSVLSIIFGTLQKRDNPTRLATAGLVCGIIGTVFNIIYIVLIFLFLLLSYSY